MEYGSRTRASAPRLAATSPGDGTGRHRGLKSPCPSGRVGSNPTPGTRRSGDLFDFGLLLAGPGAGRVRERRAGLVVERGPRALEDRALQGRRRHDLRHRRVAVRRLGRLAVVHDPPRLLEQLLRDEAADEAAGDTEWDEQDF